MFLFNRPASKRKTLTAAILVALLFSALAGALTADLATANPTIIPITVEIESPQNKTYYQNRIPVIFTHHVPYEKHHYYQLDGQERVAFSPNFNGSAYGTTLYGLTNGAHNLTITVLSSYNIDYYHGFSSIIFTVDTAPPKVSVLTPKNQTYHSPDVPLDFTVDKPVSWLGYSLDGAATTTIRGNTTLTGLSKGLHTLVIFAGNTGKSETVTFTVAEALPTSQLVAASILASAAAICLRPVAYFTKRKKKQTP